MTSDNSTPNPEDNSPENASGDANKLLNELSEATAIDESDNTFESDANQEQETDSGPAKEPASSQVNKISANKKVKSPRSGGGAVSWLALLFAVAAVAGSAYNYWHQQQLIQTASENVNKVEDTASTLKRDLQTDVQSRLNSLSADSEKLMNELAQSNSRLERKLSLDVQELDARLSENEQQVVSLKGFSDAAKYAYVKAEIEYFLQTANNRIQLAQDPGSALAALEAADERLNILRDPGLVRIRAQVRDEIQALKAVEQPDIQGLALTLASLSKQVPALPLRMDDDENDYFKEGVKLKEGTGFRVAMSNVWRNMRGTLDRLVEVRDATPSDVPLLSVSDVRLVYANLDIQLQSARLASLKGDQENYRISLESAAKLLTSYFDSEQKSIQAMIDTIAQIKSVELSPNLPDISQSLKLLRELRSADKAGKQSE